MEPALKLYLVFWMNACIVAVIAMFRLRADLELFQRNYWTMLTQNWKLATFLIAAIGLTTMAPYTGDPTWDYVDAAFMSVLTYVTSPWAVAIFFRTWRFQQRLLKLYIAACVAMFSSSWSYDGYLLLRDGVYPFTWLPNIFASGVLYICAGLMWNLEWRVERGVHFGFTEADWPRASGARAFSKLIWFGLPFMILVAAMILPFLL